METERIILRPWCDSDASTLFKYASDPEVGPRAGWPPHKSVEESLQIIRTLFSTEGMWAVELKETREAIGCVGYLTASRSNLRIAASECEVGYWIARPYWGQGLCSEALKLMVSHCFYEKEFTVLWGDYFPENPASGRVMEKCGFHDTGCTVLCPNLAVGADRPVHVMRLDIETYKSTTTMEHKFCQSCGMPLTEELLGTNADGSKNEEYCIYCYKDGAFTGDFTMEGMAEFCAQFVDEYNKNTGQSLSREEYKSMLLGFYPNLKRWQHADNQAPHAASPIKQQLIDEVNALGIKEMPSIENLFVMQGSFINMEYTINGNKAKLLNDDATYWCNQVEKGDGRCFGIACDKRFILVSEYGKNGVDAELVLIKKRGI